MSDEPTTLGTGPQIVACVVLVNPDEPFCSGVVSQAAISALRRAAAAEGRVLDGEVVSRLDPPDVRLPEGVEVPEGMRLVQFTCNTVMA